MSNRSAIDASRAKFIGVYLWCKCMAQLGGVRHSLCSLNVPWNSPVTLS